MDVFLAKDVEVDGVYYEQGTVLTAQDVKELQEVEEIAVYGGLIARPVVLTAENSELCI